MVDGATLTTDVCRNHLIHLETTYFEQPVHGGSSALEEAIRDGQREAQEKCGTTLNATHQADLAIEQGLIHVLTFYETVVRDMTNREECHNLTVWMDDNADELAALQGQPAAFNHFPALENSALKKAFDECVVVAASRYVDGQEISPITGKIAPVSDTQIRPLRNYWIDKPNGRSFFDTLATPKTEDIDRGYQVRMDRALQELVEIEGWFNRGPKEVLEPSMIARQLNRAEQFLQEAQHCYEKHSSTNQKHTQILKEIWDKTEQCYTYAFKASLQSAELYLKEPAYSSRTDRRALHRLAQESYKNALEYAAKETVHITPAETERLKALKHALAWHRFRNFFG